jgi:hypothetical protein
MGHAHVLVVGRNNVGPEISEPRTKLKTGPLNLSIKVILCVHEILPKAMLKSDNLYMLSCRNSNIPRYKDTARSRKADN